MDHFVYFFKQFSNIPANSFRMANEVQTPHQIHLMNMNIGNEDENSSNQMMFEDAEDDIESGK